MWSLFEVSRRNLGKCRSHVASASVFPRTSAQAVLATTSFGAGHFIGLEGKHNVLIIREARSKLPADLGRDICATLLDRKEPGQVRSTVEAFVRSF